MAHALALFAEFGFRSLAEKLTSLKGQQAEMPKSRRVGFAILSTHPTPSRDSSINWPSKPASRSTPRHERLAALGRDRGPVLRVEHGGRLVLAVRGPPDSCCLDSRAALDALRPIMENPAVKKIGQNLKYDMIVLRTADVTLAARSSTPCWPAICSTPASATTTLTTWPSSI